MEYSQRLKKEAQKYSVPAQTLVMADLMSIGYTENEAYTIAYSDNASLSKQQNITIRENITRSAKFLQLLDDRRSQRGMTAAVPDGELKPQYSKEEVASKLRAQIEMLPDGSKEKADVLMKYADLFAYKKEEKKAEEEDVIRVWMPLTCDICPYLKHYRDNEAGTGKKREESPEDKEG